jgi:hypothetical protein
VRFIGCIREVIVVEVFVIILGFENVMGCWFRRTVVRIMVGLSFFTISALIRWALDDRVTGFVAYRTFVVGTVSQTVARSTLLTGWASVLWTLHGEMSELSATMARKELGVGEEFGSSSSGGI